MRESAYVKLPLELFLQKRYKVAISLPELTSQTNSFSHRYAPGCSAKLLDSDPSQLYLHYRVTCTAKWSDPRGHEVRIKFDVSQVTEETVAKSLDVRASCSCPAFLYYGAQWNLHQRDSLEGVPRPLLAPPQERLDLRGHFVLCKHCWVVMHRILPSVQHNIVKILRQREVERKKKERPELLQAPPKLKERQDKTRERTKNRQDQKEKVNQIRKELEEAARERDLKNKNVRVIRTEPATHEHEVPNEPDIHDPEEERQDALQKELIKQEEDKLLEEENQKKDKEIEEPEEPIEDLPEEEEE